ncbi:MAG: hypothetical protein WBC68_01705 [Albidovulum sp.]
MELLVILLAEALAALLAPLFGLLGAILALLLEAIFLLISSLLGGRSKARAARDPAPERRPVQYALSRRWLHIPAIFAVLIGGVLLGINAFFFEPALRFGLDRVGERTGYDVQFDAASGSLLNGHVVLEGASVTRGGAAGPVADIKAEHVVLDVALLSLLSSERRIERLELSGVTGALALPAVEAVDAKAEPQKKQRRRFVVEDVRIADVDLSVAHGSQTPYRIEIVRAEAAPFRSRLAVFDLFFRSNLEARIDGTPLRVATREIAGQGRRTEWDFDQVPGVLLARFVPRAPVNWLKAGMISVHVEDEWAREDRRIDMDWTIALDGVRVSAPEGAGIPERVSIAALDKVLALRDGDADFNFTLDLDREGLETSSSGDLTALWDALKDGVAAAVAATTETPKDVVKGQIGKASDALRNLISP